MALKTFDKLEVSGFRTAKTVVLSAETYDIIRNHPEHNIWGNIVGL